MKPILPSLKEKKRYLVFQVLSEPAAAAGPVYREVMQRYGALFGELSLAEQGPVLASSPDASGTGMIRISREGVRSLKAAMATVTHVDGREAIVRTMGISGTIKRAITKYSHNK